MAIEHIVADECRRCYRCISVCPQVDKPIKDYVRGFRRVERIVHWSVAVSAVILALTGITIFHYRESLPTEYYYMLGAIHRTFAIALLVAVLLFAFGDGRHFRRALHKTFTWTTDDGHWALNVAEWILSLGKRGKLMRGDFNTGQKTWYAFLIVAISLFAISGIMQWAGPNLLGKGTAQIVSTFHSNLAVVFDVLVIIHVSLKLIFPSSRDVIRGVAHSLEIRRIRGKKTEATYPLAEPYMFEPIKSEAQ